MRYYAACLARRTDTYQTLPAADALRSVNAVDADAVLPFASVENGNRVTVGDAYHAGLEGMGECRRSYEGKQSGKK